MAMELDPVEEDDDDDDQPSTTANPYGAMKARYDSMLEKALRIQNFLDDFANQLERVQVCKVPWSWSGQICASGLELRGLSAQRLVPALAENRHQHATPLYASRGGVSAAQALLTWRDPTATRMVMSVLSVAAVGVALAGLPTCLCAFLLYKVHGVSRSCSSRPCTVWRGLPFKVS